MLNHTALRVTLFSNGTWQSATTYYPLASLSLVRENKKRQPKLEGA